MRPTLRCRHCGGKGVVPNAAFIGASMRTKRERLGLGVRQIARLARCSASYVSDLESGRRGWDGPVAQRISELLRVAGRRA